MKYELRKQAFEKLSGTIQDGIGRLERERKLFNVELLRVEDQRYIRLRKKLTLKKS